MRPQHRWADNIKIGHKKEIGCEDDY